MKDIYVEKFTQVIEQTWSKSGLEIPHMLQLYVAAVLADHVERTDFFSKPMGIRYMQIDNTWAAKDLGDNCLVLVGLFPGYRGMNDSYYAQIGAGAYATAASATRSEIFDAMSSNFNNIRFGLNQLRPPTFL